MLLRRYIELSVVSQLIILFRRFPLFLVRARFNRVMASAADTAQPVRIFWSVLRGRYVDPNNRLDYYGGLQGTWIYDSVVNWGD